MTNRKNPITYPLHVDEVSTLWAMGDPTFPWKKTENTPPEKQAEARTTEISLMLHIAFQNGEIVRDLAGYTHGGDLYFSKEALFMFAAEQGYRPAFLCDEMPSEGGEVFKSRPGAPHIYNWRLANAEMARYVVTNGKLQKTQADMDKHILEWFSHHYDDEPGLSTVKEKVKEFYRLYREAEAMAEKEASN